MAAIDFAIVGVGLCTPVGSGAADGVDDGAAEGTATGAAFDASGSGGVVLTTETGSTSGSEALAQGCDGGLTGSGTLPDDVGSSLAPSIAQHLPNLKYDV